MSRKTPWDIVWHYETPWDIMRHCETLWETMIHHAISWETPWVPMRHHETPWYIISIFHSGEAKKYLHRGLHLALNFCTVGYVLHWIFVHGDYFSSWIFAQVFFALNLWTGGYYLTWIFVQMNTSCIESMHRGLFRVVTLCTDVDYFLP